MGVGACRGGGGTSSGCTDSGIWLFCKCSGVSGREPGAEEGASVGEVVADGGGGRAEGSNSRSGTGGTKAGRRVTRSMSSRRRALNTR
jgi:hypothetical protein